MFNADLERIASVEGPGGLTLVYAHTSFRAVTSVGGGGYAYKHPVAVRHEPSGVEVPVRDYVMTLRLACAAVLALAVMTRWIYGR
jgi:hypothetical protein